MDYTEPKITHISVGGQPIGLRNLEQIFANVRRRTTKSEEDLKRALLEETRRMKNYIASSAVPKYEKALLREYRRHVGEPFEDDQPRELIIRVLGRGCPRCRQLTQEVMTALSELELGADVEHVTHINDIAQYGVVGTPALIINKQVKSVGRVPRREQIKKWLQEENPKTRE